MLDASQPTDANSVLLRRGAAARARRIADEDEAMSMLRDAARGGDDSLTHAIGYRARHSDGSTCLTPTGRRTPTRPTRLLRWPRWRGRSRIRATTWRTASHTRTRLPETAPPSEAPGAAGGLWRVRAQSGPAKTPSDV